MLDRAAILAQVTGTQLHFRLMMGGSEGMDKPSSEPAARATAASVPLRHGEGADTTDGTWGEMESEGEGQDRTGQAGQDRIVAVNCPVLSTTDVFVELNSPHPHAGLRSKDPAPNADGPFVTRDGTKGWCTGCGRWAVKPAGLQSHWQSKHHGTPAPLYINKLRAINRRHRAAQTQGSAAELREMLAVTAEDKDEVEEEEEEEEDMEAESRRIRLSPGSSVVFVQHRPSPNIFHLWVRVAFVDGLS